jgi:hypothetical protein
VSSVAQVLLWWGLDCGFFQPALPPYPSHLLPLNQWGQMMESPATTQNSNCQHTILQNKYSTTLLEEFTSWDVVSVTFNFLATRLRTTLRGLLGGAGRLASRLVDGSSMRGTLGSPGLLNLDRSWNRSCSVSLSSSDVSSMVTVSSPSLTSRCSLALRLPSSGISTCRGRGGCVGDKL